MARKNDSDLLELILLTFKSHFIVGYILGLMLFFMPEILMLVMGNNMFLIIFMSWISILFRIAGLLCIIGGTYSLVTDPKNEKIIKGLAAVICAAVLTVFISSFFATNSTQKSADAVVQAEINASKSEAPKETAVQKRTVSSAITAQGPAKPGSDMSGEKLESLEHNGRESLDRFGYEQSLNLRLRPFHVKWNRSGSCQIRGLLDAMNTPTRKFGYTPITAAQRQQVYEEQYPYVVDAFNHGCVIKLNAFELQNEAVYNKYMYVKSQIASEARCNPYFGSIDTATLSQYSDDIKIKHLSDILYDASLKQCLTKKVLY